ncbi:MAG: AAA family ATPase [Sedimentisphaerales bacterium]|nr:AAA family ATPase [Sedimentisphaerales bacterium]
MKRNSAAVFRHIADTLFLIVVASSIVLVVWRCGQGYCERATSWVGQVHPLALGVAVIGLSSLAGWKFPKKVNVSVRALTLFPRHWGLLARVNLACVLSMLLACSTGLFKAAIGEVGMLAIYGFGLESAVVFVAFITARLHLALRGRAARGDGVSRTEDAPIQHIEENLFPEYADTTNRILNCLESGRIDGGRGPNIALIGPYGSGKTSICNLVEDISRKKGDASKLVFCRFEAWQFLSAEAAVRGLLDEIVNMLDELVDCSGVGSLPEKYLDALRACPNGWVGVVATMLGRRQMPQEIVGGIEDVLLRLRKRVVVFVDDFDRLEAKSQETQQAIAAALNQLQNLTTVQYVLCVGPMRDGPGADLLKLTRFQELVPQVRGKDALETIEALREEALRGEERMYYPWDLKKEGADDPLWYSPMLESFSRAFASQVIGLIGTPRELKAVEREMREKWDGGLKGELSWYDLLLVSALKAGEPRVFEWILREEATFMDEEIHIIEPSEEDKKAAKNKIEEELNELLEIRTEPRSKLVRQVLLNLFPNFMKGLGGPAEEATQREPELWGQSIALKPGYETSYFRRYIAGGVPSTETPDQPTLQYIRGVFTDGFKSKDFQERYLATNQKLTNDLNKFVQFSGLLNENLGREICECILEWMCDREHWSVWDEPERYVSAVMSDVKSIVDNAGQFEFSFARRKRGRGSEGAAGSREDWCKQRLEALLSRDVIVAQSFGHHVGEDTLGRVETENLVGAGCTREFLSNPEGFWEQAKGHSYYLSWLLNGLKFSDDYKSIRNQVTESILEIVEADRSADITEGMLISLVHFQYPASRPDLIEEYEFSVNKQENQQKYNMDKVLPVLKRWEGRSFDDQVAYKGFEHLLAEYAEELAQLE